MKGFLAQNLVFLRLNLEQNHNSLHTQRVLESSHDKILQDFACALSMPTWPKRTSEIQVTSLARALLEFSGGIINLLQRRFAAEYTASDNANLFASILAMTRTSQFGKFDATEMCNTLSRSKLFSMETIREEDLCRRAIEMMRYLCLGFPEGYLVRYSRLKRFQL